MKRIMLITYQKKKKNNEENYWLVGYWFELCLFRNYGYKVQVYDRYQPNVLIF